MRSFAWSLVSLSIFFVTASPTHAEEKSSRGYPPVTLRTDALCLKSGESEHLAVSPQGGWRFVEKLSFRASAERRGSRVAVLVDGEQRCEHDINREEAGFTCSIERTAVDIAFRHVKGDQITISRVMSYQSAQAPSKITARDLEEIVSFNSDAEESGGFRDRSFETYVLDEVDPPRENVASYLADRTIQAVQLLFRRLQDELLGEGEGNKQVLNDLNAIKVVAAQAKAVARPNKDLSFSTVFAMLKVQKQIDGMSDTITKLLKRRNTYELALQLLTIREFIEDRLDTYKIERLMEKDADAVRKLLSSRRDENDS